MEGRYNDDHRFVQPYTGPNMIYMNSRCVVNHKGVNYECYMVDINSYGELTFDFLETIHQTNAPATQGVFFGDVNWYTHLREFVIEQNSKRYKINGQGVKISDEGQVTLVFGKSTCQLTDDQITPDVSTHADLYEAMIQSAPSVDEIKKYKF